jgi:hypothetical protein
MSAVLIPIFAMFIPIVAIAGGLTVAAVRTFAQTRVAELAMKERIAAIEKGLDPGKLPPLPQVGDPSELRSEASTPRERALQLAQGLAIGAAITTFAGLGLSIMLFVLPEAREHSLWVLGAVPVFVGIGLAVASRIVRQGAPAEASRAGQPQGAPSSP